MHTALRGMNVVGEGEGGLVVAIVILHGDLRHGIALLPADVDHLLVQRCFRAVQIGDELPDTALVAHGMAALLLRLLGGSQTLVGNGDPQAGIQKCLLPHPGMEDVIAVNRFLKHLRVRLEGHGGTGVIRGAHDRHRLRHMAPGELHLVDLAVTMDLDHQPLRQCVHHGCAHAVQTAGHLVAAAAELAAGVEHGVHHLQSGFSRLGLNVHGDTAAVIHHGDGVAFVDGHGNFRAVARQRFVDGVVHDLVNQMVQAGGGGGADIHTGPLPHSLQAFQHLDFRCVVIIGGIHRRGLQDLVFCHVGSPFIAGPEESSRSHFRLGSSCPEEILTSIQRQAVPGPPHLSHSTSFSLSARFFRVEVFNWLRYTICG